MISCRYVSEYRGTVLIAETRLQLPIVVLSRLSTRGRSMTQELLSTLTSGEQCIHKSTIFHRVYMCVVIMKSSQMERAETGGNSEGSGEQRTDVIKPTARRTPSYYPSTGARSWQARAVYRVVHQWHWQLRLQVCSSSSSDGLTSFPLCVDSLACGIHDLKPQV